MQKWLFSPWVVKYGGYLGRSLFVLYLGLNIFAFFFTDTLMFRPPKSSYQDTPEILKLPISQGQNISAFYLSNPQAKYTILYSHGNGSDIGKIRPKLEMIQKIGFSVFAYDYQGYGTSQGKPSEQNAYNDINAAYDYLTNTRKIPANRIILYGFSLGSGPSIDLASRQPVAGVILQGGFMSAFRVKTQIPILPFDRFNNISKIQSIRCPILIIHGTQDAVIPFYHGQKLFEQAVEPKQFVAIAGANHNNLMEVAGDRYTTALHNFIQLVEKSQ